MATTKRIALVTGGMGGLGEAICIKLAKLGDTVATTYSPGNTKAQEWLKSMKVQGYHFHAYLCDVTDWGSCQACTRKMTEDLGPVDEWLPQRHLGEGSPNRTRALWSDYGMAVLHSLRSPRFGPLSQK